MSLIIKMDSIKELKHLDKAVPYIMNEAKSKGLVCSNSGTTASEILNTFAFTRENVKATGKRVGYHYKFSFSKDEEITPEQALCFIEEWVDEYLGDRFDYVCSVHSDRDHLHMHLIFNSACREGGKYRYEKGDWDRIIKPLTNRLAEKYHTGALREKDETLDYCESKERKATWRDVVRNDIDKCIELSESYEEFKEKMVSEFNYQLREGVSREHGVYLALTPPGKAKAVRTQQLGDEYMPAQIDKRIAAKEQGELYNQEDERFDPDNDENYKAIYKYEIWYISRPVSFVPYKHLSMYQQYYVRKMLAARRLYKGTGSTLQMREQASTAIKGMSEDASFICMMNIRSEKELHKMIEDLIEERNETSGPLVQKASEEKKAVIRRLKELDNQTFRRDVKHK